MIGERKKRKKEKQSDYHLVVWTSLVLLGFLYLAGRTGYPEGRSSPWSCSGGRVPSQHASGHPTIGVATRRNRAVRGSRKGASEGACTLERSGREAVTKTILCFFKQENSQKNIAIFCSFNSGDNGNAAYVIIIGLKSVFL